MLASSCGPNRFKTDPSYSPCYPKDDLVYFNVNSGIQSNGVSEFFSSLRSIIIICFFLMFFERERNKRFDGISYSTYRSIVFFFFKNYYYSIQRLVKSNIKRQSYFSGTRKSTTSGVSVSVISLPSLYSTHGIIEYQKIFERITLALTER